MGKLEMVLRYAGSVTLEDCMRHRQALLSQAPSSKALRMQLGITALLSSAAPSKLSRITWQSMRNVTSVLRSGNCTKPWADPFTVRKMLLSCALKTSTSSSMSLVLRATLPVICTLVPTGDCGNHLMVLTRSTLLYHIGSRVCEGLLLFPGIGKARSNYGAGFS